MSAVVGNKVLKKGGKEPTELELNLAQAFSDLESTSKDLKGDLRDLYFLAAKEIAVDESKKAIIVFVPFVKLAKFKKIQPRLVREFEKKFTNKHIVFIGQRTVLGAGHARASKGALRPRSRTVQAVHEAILNDVVYPTEIVGKRIRFRLDGSKLHKVYLDPKEAPNVDYKLATFASVYRKLTNKNIEFMFPSNA